MPAKVRSSVEIRNVAKQKGTLSGTTISRRTSALIIRKNGTLGTICIDANDTIINLPRSQRLCVGRDLTDPSTVPGTDSTMERTITLWQWMDLLPRDFGKDTL